MCEVRGGGSFHKEQVMVIAALGVLSVFVAVAACCMASGVNVAEDQFIEEHFEGVERGKSVGAEKVAAR